MNRLHEKYNKEIVPSLREKYNYKSLMAIPKLDKIVGDGWKWQSKSHDANIGFI